MNDAVKVLVISGSMGSGKTTVLDGASSLLKTADILHAALDLDFLSLGHYNDTGTDDLMLRNLAAVWNNYVTVGATRLLLCKPIDTTDKLERLRETIPGADIVICRLRAKLDTMQERVRVREPGPDQDQLVAHVHTLEKYLDAGRVEDFSVDNDNRPVTEVAREVLVRAGWL